LLEEALSKVREAHAAWPLQLNAITFELALGDFKRASARCESFLWATKAAGLRDERLWLLSSRVMNEASLEALEPGELAESTCMEAQLLWQERLAEQVAVSAPSHPTSRFESWYRLLLSSSRLRAEALQIIGLVAHENAPSSQWSAVVLQAVLRWARGDKTNAPASEPSTTIVSFVEVVLCGLIGDAAQWSVEAHRERGFLNLLWISWLQLRGAHPRVVLAFENAISRCTSAALIANQRSAELPLLWLHYLYWAAHSKVDDVGVPLVQLLRRCVEDLCGERCRARHGTGGTDEDELAMVLQLEPARSFFCCQTSRDLPSDFDAMDELWAEASTLAGHLCLRHIRHAQPLKPAKLRLPPTLCLLLAAQAVRLGASKHAHSALSTALSRDASHRDCWTFAIRLHASEGAWESASALAHVAVANHFNCAELWQQWLEIEEMRGNVETALRLRALASAAGVRATG